MKLTPDDAHPDTRWFETAGLGMFLCWGISTVRAVGDLSWAMIRGTGYDAELNNANKLTPEDYWQQADEFDPGRYDPRRWMAAARDAGFRYAVFNCRHHDGYALWPSEFGDLGTRTHLGGRDLVQPYVEACREYSLKVGLYYSPDDWYRERHRRAFGSADGGPLGLRHEPVELPTSTPAQQRQWRDEEAPYVSGQIEELLTRYGEIDVFWFDGSAPSMPNARIRELQPGIVINDRGHGAGSGDFATFECRYEALEPARPERPFEFCTTTIDQYDHLVTAYLGAPSWAHLEGARYRPLALMLEEFVKVRAWGGNYLLNFGPTRDGELPDEAYRTLSELGDWMGHSGVGLSGVYGGPWPDDSNVPVTVAATADNVERTPATWYLHFLPGFSGVAEVRGVSAPAMVRLLRTGEPLEFGFSDQVLKLAVPASLRTGPVDVVEMNW